jgi:hypothetical protein
MNRQAAVASYIMETSSPSSAYRNPVVIASIIWCAVVIWSVGGALRHGDGATYINGGWQIATEDISPWHVPDYNYPTFFNYNFEYGNYWLLAALLRLTGLQRFVVVSNYAQAILFCISLGGLTYFRFRATPFFLVLPFLLCPALVLYVSFMGPGVISLAFLPEFAVSGHTP